MIALFAGKTRMDMSWFRMLYVHVEFRIPFEKIRSHKKISGTSVVPLIVDCLFVLFVYEDRGRERDEHFRSSCATGVVALYLVVGNEITHAESGSRRFADTPYDGFP